MPARRGGPPWANGGQKPPWWPEDEPWPPGEGGPSPALRRRFAIRILILLGILLALCVTAAIIFHDSGNWQDNREYDGDGPPPFIFPIFFLVIIGIVGFLIIRRLRRTIAPIGQMMLATERVAEGDYSARIEGENHGELSPFVNAFNGMVERLETNDDQRKRLLADVAHELRTPLAVIQGTLEGMIDGVYDRGDDELLPLMEQTKVISRLLDDLQTVSNAEAGALRLDKTEVDLRSLLTDVADRFRGVAQRSETTLGVDAPEGLEVRLDPVRMRQVLDNLVTNAIRYTPGGDVQLSATSSTDQVTITVRDTGKGMPPEDASRMFERFVKSADSGGSGLGLAIARSLVVAHGGTISAISAPGQGTTVTIALPR